MTAIWQLRAAILTLVAALAVHHGRYAFATPQHEHELSGAHAYLTWLGPVAGMMLFLAVVQLGARLGRAGRTAPELPRGRSLWLAATICLLAVFGIQESLETWFAHGHLPQLAEVLGDGGWTALPFALAAGAGVALLLRGAAHVARLTLIRARHALRRLAPDLPAPPTPALAAPKSVLGRRLAGRAPPALSSST